MSSDQYLKAYEQYKAGNFEKAVEIANSLVSSDPKFFRAHVLSALGSLQLKKFRDGAESCEKAIKLAPTYHKAYAIMAECLRGLKKFNDSIDTIKKAIELSPTPEYYFNLGIYLMDLGSAQEAADAFSLAVKMEPSSSEYVSDFANACFNAGKIEDAVAVLESYNARFPGHKREIEFKTRISFARKNKLQNAITQTGSLHETSIYLDPYNPETEGE